MIGSIVLDGVLTRSVLLSSVCDLKAAQMNVQRSLIRKLMFYEFEPRLNTAKATQNIFCAKGKDSAGHRWF